MIKPLQNAFSALTTLFLFSITSFSQDIKWNAAPRTGFVFQISNKEAQKLLTRSSPDTIFNGLLHTMVDTFGAEKGWIKRPAKGHFILARIVENKLHCEYTSVFPYQVFLLKAYDALALQVLDLNGNVREDAKVKFKLRRLGIDPESKTYRLANDWVKGGNRIVTVELDGFRSVFNIEKHEVPTWYNDYYNDDGPSFYSYMITDKNKYKPNEKVRFKSYALSQSRTPLRKDLEVWLINGSKSTKVGQVAAHRPGSYTSEFQLHDSLNLTLDRPYNLQLIEKKGRIVSSCNFKYEDYELHGNKLDIQLATNKHYHPSKNTLSITATDVNNLVLKDVRASIVVKTQSIRETFQSLVILPDTLLFTEIDLDPNAATVVDIPSDLFQKTNTTYQVQVTVLNSQNQGMARAATASHYYSQYELTTRFSNDTIIYEIENNGIPMRNVPMMLQHNDETEIKEIRLPYKEKLNPVISTIRLQGDLASREIFLRNLMPRLELEGGIRNDSFNIFLHNPQKLEVSWYIYQGSLMLQKGFGTELEYRSIIENRTQTFYVELLYSFGGEDQIKRKEYEFREGYLNVSLDVPERVYPGQRVDANITVTDQSGYPVSGVDLTALALTAKLNQYLPDLPYYGTSSTPRSKTAHYSKTDINKRSAILDLDYKKWEQRARLDTMKYYQFTYPGSMLFRYTTEIADSSQFVPYVMQDGRAIKPYVIELDRKPIYYSWADQPREYSFYVSPVRNHEVSIRLYDRVLVLDSLSFDACRKTILSIDLDHLPEGTKVYQMFTPVAKRKNRKYKRYPTFTPTEISRHLSYISFFRTAEGNAYLENAKEFVPLFSAQFPVPKETIIAGPITPGKQNFNDHKAVKTTYRHTGGYMYAFEDNIVYKLNGTKLIPDVLYKKDFNPMTNINDKVMTKDKFLEYKNSGLPKWHTRAIHLVDHASDLIVLLPDEKEGSGVAAFLFQDCKTKQIISPCQNHYVNKPDFYTIPRGCHNAILIYNNGTYLEMKGIDLKAYHKIVVDLNQAPLHPADSLSWMWLLTPSNNCYSSIPTFSKSISINYTGQSFGNVKGAVYDETNMPIPGANVIVKGTSTGAVTDIEGRFALDITEPRATLVVSFIGYATKEVEVQIGSDVSVFMLPDIQQLSEVVVIGYGMIKSEHLAYALSGRVSGVNISAGNEEEPIDEEGEREEETNREAEQKLYQELLTLNSIRSDFSDVGFWEPRLFTDKHGNSRFTITFPDDITRWDATVYAMNRHLQTGTARKTIKSYKPIMAELHVPQFLTRGDSAFFLGKILNYTGDKSITGIVKWNGAKTDFERPIQFTEFHTDKLPVYAAGTDSLKTRYLFTREDGYLDGEERTIPVVEQGVIRADGTLSILKNKEEVHVKASSKEHVTIEFLNNQLDIYAGEVRYLVDYKYACNEQLASKLLGLINHKMLMQFEGRPFRYDRDVNRIIARLLKNQNQEFLWSWWDVSSNTSYWMSAHILRALKAALDAGYKVELNIENIVRKAEYKFDNLHQYSLTDTDVLNALASWNAKLNYSKHVNKLDSIIQKRQNERHHLHTTMPQYRMALYQYSLLKEKLLLQEIRQIMNLPYQRDSLLRYKRERIMGDIHFSDRKLASYWYDDELAANAIAYRIVKRDSLLGELLAPMQMYFLSQRKNGAWNTYHSSSVLMSVLPDLIAEGVSKGHMASIKLSGKVNGTIDKFPYRITLLPQEDLHIRKESGLPIYYMHYVEERVTKAKTGVEGFEIKTSLGNDQKIVEAGKPVALTVEVDVKKDASFEYVMIEVPIPGACGYADKSQRNNRIETHREYFKERTVIFCEQMKTGKYTFVIQLLPSFTGKYLINPAQVSLMYVPVVNANTDIKVVKVIEN